MTEKRLAEPLNAQLRGSCHMCGKCCEAIHIGTSPQQIRSMAEDHIRYRGADDTNDDAVFVHLNWEPISYEQAMEINPHFGRNVEHMKAKGVEGAEDLYKRLYFYTCKHFDKGQRNCSIHPIRPQVCSGYPWYGNSPGASFLFYSEDCGYQIDVPKEASTS